MMYMTDVLHTTFDPTTLWQQQQQQQLFERPGSRCNPESLHSPTEKRPRGTHVLIMCLCFKAHVKIRPQKACNYPNLVSFGWFSYDEVGVLYSGKLGNGSEVRASDLISHPGLWWNRIKLRLYNKGEQSEYSPRICSIGRPAGALCVPKYNLTYGVVGRTERKK